MGNYWMKWFEVTLLLDDEVVYTGRVKSKSRQSAITNVLVNKYKGTFDNLNIKEVIDATAALEHASVHLREACASSAITRETLVKIMNADVLKEEVSHELVRTADAIEASILKLNGLLGKLTEEYGEGMGNG